MRQLIAFIIRSSSWLLFILYAAIACSLLFTANPFQHYAYLTSAGALSSSVYSVGYGISGYFGLRTINADLQRQNTELRQEVLTLQAELDNMRLVMASDTVRLAPAFSRYSFVLANVINNSTTRSHNYATINRGSLDGVQSEMGVVDQNGIVGIVNVVGKHTARVITLLNPYLRVSCKVKGQDMVGSLVWDGQDPSVAVLEELPRHAVFHKGDTIVTSGFSSAFPEGVPVGTVINAHKERDDNFFALRVKLFTDFRRLSTVQVVTDSLAAELRTVETEITPSKGVGKIQ